MVPPDHGVQRLDGDDSACGASGEGTGGCYDYRACDAKCDRRRFPRDFTGVSPCCGTSDVVAVYSATDGHLIRKLTVPMPGGGPGDPRLSPDGARCLAAADPRR